MQQHSAMAIQSVDPADRPLKELVSGIGKDMGLLIRQEIQLAKAEISEKTARVTKGAVSIGIGAFLAYAGVLALVSALVLMLITVGLTPWLAAALIAAVLLIAGFGMVQGGRKKLASGKPTLERTKENAKETVHRLKEQLQ
jgi:uncharacterized membrane protein YqjE